MWNIEVKNGAIYLNGEVVPCVKNFKLVSPENPDGSAELTICLDVAISGTDF